MEKLSVAQPLFETFMKRNFLLRATLLITVISSGAMANTAYAASVTPSSPVGYGCEMDGKITWQTTPCSGLQTPIQIVGTEWSANFAGDGTLFGMSDLVSNNATYANDSYLITFSSAFRSVPVCNISSADNPEAYITSVTDVLATVYSKNEAGFSISCHIPHNASMSRK
jgi:hypothetical protein